MNLIQKIKKTDKKILTKLKRRLMMLESLEVETLTSVGFEKQIAHKNNLVEDYGFYSVDKL